MKTTAKKVITRVLGLTYANLAPDFSQWFASLFFMQTSEIASSTTATFIFAAQKSPPNPVSKLAIILHFCQPEQAVLTRNYLKRVLVDYL